MMVINACGLQNETGTPFKEALPALEVEVRVRDLLWASPTCHSGAK
jgi:hypothetical protein